VVDICSEIIVPESFYRPSHGLIFQAMLDVSEKGEPVDALTHHDRGSAPGPHGRLSVRLPAVAFVGGLFSGFLGGGAGYIRMPSMVYVLGIPTHLAVGTDLFEIIISASYGTFSHAVKGNVDILIALVMHTGAAIGAQIGAISTQYFAGPKIRLAFVPLPLIGAAIVIYTLLTGHKL